MVVVPIAVALCLVLVTALLLTLCKRNRLDLERIPAATLKDVLLLATCPRRSHEWFRQCHERYGPIFRLKIAHREVVMVADTRAAQEVLSAGPHYLPQKSYEYSAIEPVRAETCLQSACGEGHTQLALAGLTAIVHTECNGRLRTRRHVLLVCHQDQGWVQAGDGLSSYTCCSAAAGFIHKPAMVRQAHGLQEHSGMLSHRDERLWKIHRGALAPAYTLSALK